ncbi:MULTISPECIES: T9SS-dependent choice-of-anchor J family protein [unclassified Lentimicrobium]|uniref:T9SS-dependent choice-of-anchor J family protein n=1 Tax=unclassified Lentimicrobium TaxID=2677434 RepID=UPI0015525B21|nr:MULTISPECIES: choice-of-anchor J domain-containing protein [unclassified Lentimicrobium]NPD45691.1 T9SS type A sorting domain-containing protein [Lentimicrobium sp. S6]NPD85570.1 T9SS type A sorting domain-containing protein [Lentimicrobium sp. L6]
MIKRIFDLLVFILFFTSLNAQNVIGQKIDNDKTQSESSDISMQNDSANKQTKQKNSYILPFLEYFDNGTFPPTDWITYRGINGAGINYDWDINKNGGYDKNGAMVYWENIGGTILEDWLVSPLITLGSISTLSFFEKQDYTTEYGSDYSIRISTNSQSLHSDFNIIASYGESSFSTAYSLREIDLSAFDGQSVYIAFVMTNDDGDSWYIDNVSIDESNTIGGGKLLISEVAYPVNEAEGRFVELYNAGDETIDLTSYYLGFYRNTQRINLVGSIEPGEKFIYAPNAIDFYRTYGFTANQSDGGIDPSWLNGTDAIILLYKRNKAAYTRLDTYGVIKADGTGKEWEYINKHAVRKANIIEDQNSMILDEWIISTAYATNYYDVTPGIHNEYYYWNGQNDTDWDNYQNWTVSSKGTSFVPDAGANVVVPSGSANSPSWALYRFPYFFNTLTIQPGANFTVASDNILKVTNDVTVASGATLSIESDAAGAATFIPEGTVIGDAKVERYMATISGIPDNGIWHLFSPAVSDFQSGDLMNQYLKYWDEPVGNWAYISTTDEILSAGKGYALMLLDNFGHTVNVTGKLNTGDVTIQNLDFTSGAGWEGYNLVGNPYTASMDWGVIQDNLPLGIDKAIHYWDVENGQYIFYNNGVGTASRFIPAGQAFFIHVNEPNLDITFTPDSRVADSSHLYYKSNKGKIYDEYQPEVKEQLNQLVVETSTSYGVTDKVFLKFHEKATSDYDGHYDAIKFTSNNDKIADAWLSFQNNDYSINTLPVNMIEGRYDMSIRFGKQESYSLTFHGIDSFEEDQPINLYDKTTSSYYDLRKYTKLNFYNTDNVIENRFEIVFAEGVGIEEKLADNTWLIFASKGALTIKNTLELSENNTFSYSIYTVEGKLIASYDYEKEVINKYHNVTSGIYVIKLITEHQQITKKVWLSK